MSRYMYILQNDDHNKVSELLHPLMLLRSECAGVVITFKIYSFNNFYTYNTVMLITVTMLCVRSPDLIL